MNDSDDILGGALRTKPPSSIPIFIKAPLFISAGLALWLCFVWSWNWVKTKQEINYRLATRRKHGIPDDDRRPFNVAYAAVSRARQEREREREKARREVEVAAEAEAKNTAWTTAVPANPTRNQPAMNVAGPSRPVVQPHLPSPAPSITIERPVVPKLRSSHIRFESSNDDTDRRKRALDHDNEDDHDHAKKTRVEGEELIDGDEDGRFHAGGGKRTAKRVLRDEEEGGIVIEKRRKKSVVEVIDVDEDEAMGEPFNMARGQKRERGVGGDEDDDEVPENEEKSRKGRKRRTMQKRKSDGFEKRGKKRDRDAEDADSPDEGEDEHSKRSSKKKRGKKSTVVVEEENEERSDVSMDSPMSKDPLCKGKKIGEEWEIGGVRYKVGPNGDRLRQSLVKKARSKFVMPEDSQHPDRQAHMEVFIETWLTEAQYKDAKERHHLAWQVSPKASTEPEAKNKTHAQSPTPLTIPETPPTGQGKNLLWSSTASSTHTPSPQGSPRPLRQSLTTNVFTSRRVSSAYINPALGYQDSNNGHPIRGQFRSFSKWEKQDLEAEAMRKMRAKLEEQKKKAADTLAPQPITASVSLPAPAPTLPSNAPVPFPKPDEKEKEKEKEVRPATSMPSISLMPPTPTNTAPPSTTGASVTPSASKPATEIVPKAATNLNSFGIAPQSNTQPPQVPSFSFPKPSQQQLLPSSSLTPASTPAVPTPPAPGPQQVKPQSGFVWPSFTPTTASAPAPAPAPAPASAPASAPAPAPSPFASWAIKPQSPAPTTIFNKEQKPEQSQAGGSLLLRMGGFSQNAGDAQFPANPATNTNSGSSTFTFKSTQIDTPQASVPANASGPPKFSFGVVNKPTNTSPIPAAGSNAANTTATAKPTQTSLGFSTKESSSSTPENAGGATNPPIFSFGVNSGGSAFGKTNTVGGGQASGPGSTSTSAAKSAFGGFGGSGNAFKTTTPAGSPATGNVFGGHSAASGWSTATPSKGGDTTIMSSVGDLQAKPAFSFGVSNPPTTGNDQHAKPAFGFGTPTSTPPPATTGDAQNKPAGGFTFQFGGANQPSAATTNPPSSVFGQPSNPTPSAFSFGAASSNTGGPNQQK